MQELNSEPVIPEGFPEWKDTMDSWGYKMISAIEVSRDSNMFVCSSHHDFIQRYHLCCLCVLCSGCC